eukprot:m.476176 g.476176  ORF g.476176 m.476176 type:complete len:162 (-) comp20459_c0_seq1:120-605(-)
MLIPKKTRKEIYSALFKDGVLVAKKDFNAPKHSELETVPNLMVIKACQSLKSRGYVKEQFAWRHFYWFLTDEGIEYLRDYLHLPSEVVPNTLKRPARPEGARQSRPERSQGGGGDDRGAYRRGPGGYGDKKTAAGGEFRPEFRGGFGRGRPQGGDAPPSGF